MNVLHLGSRFIDRIVDANIDSMHSYGDCHFLVQTHTPSIPRTNPSISEGIRFDYRIRAVMNVAHAYGSICIFI